MDILWIHGGLIGKSTTPDGKEDPGAILALRKGGDEALFASRSGRALAWMPVGGFVVDPETILTPEDLGEEIVEEPQSRAPFGVRRREGGR